MVIIVFRSRIRAGIADRYYETADTMAAIARSMPGFISYKGFTADDGERVSIHEWETPEHLKAWREHPDHKRIQSVGRDEFYEEYSLYVCDSPRTSQFRRPMNNI